MLKLGKLKRFLPLAFGLLVFAFTGSKVGWSEVFATMSKADLFGVATVFALMTCTVAIKSLREKLFLQKISKTAFPGLVPAKLFVVGVFSNEFLPAGSGEVAKAYLIKRLAKVGFGKPLAPLLIARSFDTFFLLSVGLLGISALFPSQLAAAAASLFLVIALSAFFFASIFKRDFAKKTANFFASLSQKMVRLAGFLKKTFLAGLYEKAEGLAGIFAGKTMETAHSFEESRALYVQDKALLAKAFFLTVLGWSLEGIVQQTLLASLGVQVGYFEAFAIIALSLLVGVFSFIPGGFGARDVAYAFFASLAGVPFALGFSASVLYRAIVYLWFVPTTAYSAWSLRISVREAEKAVG